MAVYFFFTELTRLRQIHDIAMSFVHYSLFLHAFFAIYVPFSIFSVHFECQTAVAILHVRRRASMVADGS